MSNRIFNQSGAHASSVAMPDGAPSLQHRRPTARESYRLVISNSHSTPLHPTTLDLRVAASERFSYPIESTPLSQSIAASCK